MSDIPDDVPEADALEQRREMDETARADDAGSGEFPTEAAEGDVIEQSQQIDSGDEDRRDEDGS